LGSKKKLLLQVFPVHLLKSASIESTFPYAMLPRHEGAKQNTIRVVGKASAKLPHYMGLPLTYPMKNKMPLIHPTIE
jgi:hypothetical protein